MGLWLCQPQKLVWFYCFWVKGRFSLFGFQKPSAACQFLGFLFFREKPTAAGRDQNAGEGNVSISSPLKPFFQLESTKKLVE